MSRIKAYQINQILSLHLGRKINDFDFSSSAGVIKVALST